MSEGSDVVMKLGVIDDGFVVNIAVGMIVGVLERLEGDDEDFNDDDDDDDADGDAVVVVDDDVVDNDKILIITVSKYDNHDLYNITMICMIRLFVLLLRLA